MKAKKQNRNITALRLSAGLEAGGERRPPTNAEIAERLRKLADDMEDIAVAMDYYGGFAEWAQHGREIAGAGNIARQWADEIEAANVYYTPQRVQYFLPCRCTRRFDVIIYIINQATKCH